MKHLYGPYGFVAVNALDMEERKNFLLEVTSRYIGPIEMKWNIICIRLESRIVLSHGNLHPELFSYPAANVLSDTVASISYFFISLSFPKSA